MESVIRQTLWALLLFLTLSAAAMGQSSQQQGQGQQPPKGQPPPAQPGQTATPAEPAAPPVNKEEEDAYKAFFGLKVSNPNVMISSGEEFLKKFPESRYREAVYSRLAQAYLNADQVDKLSAVGQKALELNPDDVDVLALMAFALPRRFNANDLDAEQKLTKYEGYSKHAVEVLGKMEKPAQLTDEDFARAKSQKLAMCHSGLGLVYMHRHRYSDAIAELEQSTVVLSSPDPTDYYLLGMLYQEVKRFGDAATAFGHCGELQWQWQDRCKQEMEQVKKLAAAQPTKP